MILSIENIDLSIQSTPILHGLSLNVEEGEIVGLVGRNGAGKTTTMRTIMGLTKPSSGTIKVGGVDITRMEAHRRPALGLGYMPEDRRLVPELTVEENMLLPSWVNSALDQTAALKFIYDLMPELVTMRERKASGGMVNEFYREMVGLRLVRPEGPGMLGGEKAIEDFRKGNAVFAAAAAKASEKAVG